MKILKNFNKHKMKILKYFNKKKKKTMKVLKIFQYK